MVEMVKSAIMEEAVSRVISSLGSKDKEKISANIERLEMAHVKMEAALHMSNKWQISDMPLVRWQRKLKRAAQECHDTLRRCKQRALEEEETRQNMRQSSFPKRIAHAAKSLVSSFAAFGNEEEFTCASVQRFERFADGASEFLKFVEFGGSPRQYMFFPLVGHLLTGKSARYQVSHGTKFCLFRIRPMNYAERGTEAMIAFFYIDLKDITKGFSLGFMLRLSESTNIFDVIIKCMQSVTPHFKFAAETVKRELIQLPTQDFSIVPHVSCGENEYWANIHNTMTQWYRPDPFCCRGHERNFITSLSTGNKKASPPSSSRLLSDLFPEEVIVVHLKYHVYLHDQHKIKQSSATTAKLGGASSLNSNVHPLKLGILFITHDSPEDIEPAAESYALEVIDEKEQETIHTNACLRDLEKLLPKAWDYLYQNDESKMYEICLKSRHGTAHLCVEKTNTEMQHRCRTKHTRHASNRRVLQKQDKMLELWKQVAKDLLKLWVVRASDKLQGSIRSWTAVHKLT